MRRNHHYSDDVGLLVKTFFVWGDVMCEPMKLSLVLNRFFKYARTQEELLDLFSLRGCEAEVESALWHKNFYRLAINAKCSKELKDQATVSYIAALRKLEAQEAV